MMEDRKQLNKVMLTIIDSSDEYSLLIMSRDTLVSINFTSFVASSCECEPAVKLHNSSELN